MVAVGLKNGEVIVLSVNGMKLWGKRRDRSGAISDVKLVHMPSPSYNAPLIRSDFRCTEVVKYLLICPPQERSPLL